MKTIDIEYSDGRVITVKPVSWKYLDDLTVLTQKLVAALGKVNGAVGKLLSKQNVEVWDYLEKVAALLPVVGNKDPGIELDLIEDPWEIVKIFFTTTDTVNDDGWLYSGDEAIAPSLLAKINALDFYSILLEVMKELKQE